MFAGQLACEAVNFALKRLIKEERPPRMNPHGKGYGMPSSHAQFAFFWAIALGLFLVVRHRPTGAGEGAERKAKPGPGTGAVANEGKPGSSTAGLTTRFRGGGLGAMALAAHNVQTYGHQPWSLIERVLASVVALGIASAVSWSRVYLDYHTPKQVLAGCLAGSACAVAWFMTTYVLRQTGLLAWALQLQVVRWFRLRDLVVEEDLCQSGWEKWEGIRLEREQRKVS